jgi:hypothetical protein
MAKRSRGTVKPGQRRPIQRQGPRSAASRPASAPAPTPVVPAGTVTPDEEARAAELEAQILAEERAAEQAQRRSRDRSRSTDLGVPRTRDAAPLAVRASAEYAYVRRDILRIARVGALLLAILIALYLLINVFEVIAV